MFGRDGLPPEDATDEELARLWHDATGMRPSWTQIWALRAQLHRLHARRRASVRRTPWRRISAHPTAAEIIVGLVQQVSAALVAEVVGHWLAVAAEASDPVAAEKLARLRTVRTEEQLLAWAGMRESPPDPSDDPTSPWTELGPGWSQA